MRNSSSDAESGGESDGSAPREGIESVHPAGEEVPTGRPQSATEDESEDERSGDASRVGIVSVQPAMSEDTPFDHYSAMPSSSKAMVRMLATELASVSKARAAKDGEDTERRLEEAEACRTHARGARNPRSDPRLLRDLKAGMNTRIAVRKWRSRIRAAAHRVSGAKERASGDIDARLAWAEKHDNPKDAQDARMSEAFENAYGAKFDGDRPDLPEKWERRK